MLCPPEHHQRWRQCFGWLESGKQHPYWCNRYVARDQPPWCPVVPVYGVHHHSIYWHYYGPWSILVVAWPGLTRLQCLLTNQYYSTGCQILWRHREQSQNRIMGRRVHLGINYQLIN